MLSSLRFTSNFSFQFSFSPLDPSVLKPDANLRLCQSELKREPPSLLPGDVLIGDKNFLQLM